MGRSGGEAAFPAQRRIGRLPSAQDVLGDAAVQAEARGAEQDRRASSRLLGANAPHRSCAAICSWTASASTCSSKNTVAASSQPSRRGPPA